MNFDDFDVDSYLQLPMDAPIVPTAPITPMGPVAYVAPIVAVRPVALTAPAISTSADILDNDLYQGQISDSYEATATKIAELDWLQPNTIEPTELEISSATTIDDLLRVTSSDPTEQYLRSTDFRYGCRDWLNDEANDPLTTGNIPGLLSTYGPALSISNYQRHLCEQLVLNSTPCKICGAIFSCRSNEDKRGTKGVCWLHAQYHSHKWEPLAAVGFQQSIIKDAAVLEELLAETSKHTPTSPVEFDNRPDSRPRCYEHGCNGRAFSNIENYRRHIREQLGLNSARCEICGALFSRKSNRDKHSAKGVCWLPAQYRSQVGRDTQSSLV
ncbi:hypothetical protein V491_00306 [Pseudogymnoascus sp. VKM F-3775]|nr:hypothetical protein V491_00306 [Pseudogymnoascus sp. VKM F-3775]